jgi:hypothetical protein
MIGPFLSDFKTCSGFVHPADGSRRWSCVGSWHGDSPQQSCDMYVVCSWKPMSWGQRSKVTAAARRFDPLRSDYVIDPIVYKTIVVSSAMLGGVWHEGEESGSFDSNRIADIDADVFDAIASAYERYMVKDEDPDPGKP